MTEEDRQRLDALLVILEDIKRDHGANGKRIGAAEREIRKLQGESMALKSSWKTTVIGWGSAALVIIGQIVRYLKTGQVDVEIILAALGLGGLGSVARDNDKTSEEVGAKSK
jgi:hypothetical protein